MTDETISEKCETLYKKLNTFVVKVINRDVQPQIDDLESDVTLLNNSKLAKGDWTIISNTESYVTTKASMITTDAWNDENEIATITQTTINVINDGSLDYFNSTNKKVSVELSITSGRVVINGNIFEDDIINFNVDANKGLIIQCYSGTFIDYTVGTQSNIISSIIDVAYPVGSIYISSSTTHPSIVFGGVWEHFAEDKFLLGVGSTYGYNTTGGSADAVVVSHNHKASTNNFVESNTAIVKSGQRAFTSTSSSGIYYVYSQNSNTSLTTHNTTQTAGESGNGKNMPPYLTVFMWKRVE